VNAAGELTEVVPRRVRMTRAARREHLLDVAADLVVEAGLEAVTMERVATRAGVSKALGYAYFVNSDDLLAALFDREMAAYDRAIATATAGAATFEERARGTIVAMFDVLTDRGHLLGALLKSQGGPAGSLADRRRRRQETAERYFADMIVTEYGLDPRDALVVAAIGLAPSAGVIDSWVRCRASRHELTDLCVGSMLRGIEGLARR
jgi:AcrR family transcriptional regulator